MALSAEPANDECFSHSNGRTLPAVVARTDVVSTDLEDGEVTLDCIFMYGLIDKEFDVYREVSSSDCTGSDGLEN